MPSSLIFMPYITQIPKCTVCITQSTPDDQRCQNSLPAALFPYPLLF